MGRLLDDGDITRIGMVVPTEAFLVKEQVPPMRGDEPGSVGKS
jgi:hypothetical protein